MKLDERFRSLARTPAPSYWSDVVDRLARPDPIPTSPAPRPSRRIAAAVVAVLVAIFGVGLILRAFEPERTVTPGGSVTPSPSASATPENGLLPSPGYSVAWLCGDGSGCPSGGVPEELRRPLQVPSLNADGTCPASPTHPVRSVFAPALGDGPVYAVLPNAGTLRFDYPPGPTSEFAGSAWSGNKVVWFAAPSYTGPILIRGGEVGGTHALGFSGGDAAAYDSMELPPGSGWRNWPTATRVQAPGCYAYQVDGTTFTEVIVFRAVETKP